MTSVVVICLWQIWQRWSLLRVLSQKSSRSVTTMHGHLGERAACGSRRRNTTEGARLSSVAMSGTRIHTVLIAWIGAYDDRRDRGRVSDRPARVLCERRRY